MEKRPRDQAANLAAMTAIESVTLEVPDATLLLGVASVSATKRVYIERGLRVAAEGSGSHRLVMGSDTPPFTDPDGFSWEEA